MNKSWSERSWFTSNLTLGLSEEAPDVRMYHVMHIQRSPESCRTATRLQVGEKKQNKMETISALRVASMLHPSVPTSPVRPFIRPSVHPSVRPSVPVAPRKKPSSSVSRKSSPGETVQCLNRSILIHDTTFEQIRKKKKLEHFYILLSRSKKKKKKREHWDFLLFASSAFWLLACNVWCIILPWGGGDDTKGV